MVCGHGGLQASCALVFVDVSGESVMLHCLSVTFWENCGRLFVLVGYVSHFLFPL